MDPTNFAGSSEPDVVCIVDVTSDVAFPFSVPGNSTPIWIVRFSPRPYALLIGNKVAGMPAREELTTSSFRGSSAPLVEPLRGDSQRGWSVRETTITSDASASAVDCLVFVKSIVAVTLRISVEEYPREDVRVRASDDALVRAVPGGAGMVNDTSASGTSQPFDLRAVIKSS